MTLLINFCLGIFVLVAALMVFVILMQRPKSEGLGAAFGGGVTENLFGAQTTNVLVKFTTWLAGIFFLLTFGLSVLYAHRSTVGSAFRRELMKQQGAPQTSPAPAGAKVIAGQFRRAEFWRQRTASQFTGSYGKAVGSAIRRSGLRFAREFRREQPQKSSFLGFRIDVEKCDASFGKFERSAGQLRNDSCKIRFVPDQHQTF